MRIRLGKPFPLTEVLRATGGISSLPCGTVFHYLTTDSREVEPGDLFVAIDGVHSSGADYIPEARAKGGIPLTSRRAEGVVLVSDSSRALLALAGHYRGTCAAGLTAFAITGSVGKTTVKNRLATLLSGEFRVHATEGNFNNALGVPLTLLTMPKNTEILVAELGMNHPGEIAALSSVVRPNHAVITGIGHAHVGNLGSLAAVARAKLEILSGMTGGTLTVPADDPFLSEVPCRRAVSFGREIGDFSVSDVKMTAAGSHFLFKDPSRTFSVSTRTPGIAEVRAISLAIGAALSANVSEEGIRRGISRIAGLAPRCPIDREDAPHLLVDAYNASPESVRAAVDTLLLYPEEKKGVMLGDMLELGGMTRSLHEAMGEYLGSLRLHSLYLFGTFAPFTYAGAVRAGMDEERIFLNNDTEDPGRTASAVQNRVPKDDLILIKGSHAVGMERIVRLLRKTRKGNDHA